MNSETYTAYKKRLLKAITLLTRKNFIHLGKWLFLKEGTVYDLGAADLDQVDTIVSKRLFVVEAWW